jgi:NADH-quinone oxidoreductase subunit A
MVSQTAAYLSQYFSIFIFIVLAIGFGAVTLLISNVVQPRLDTEEKLSPYECGSEPISDARNPFPVRYYIIAMLFVIFDVEMIFLYPWAIVFGKIGFWGLFEMIVFIGLFVFGYLYAWKKGALQWE